MLGVLAVPLLVLLNAFFVAAEFSLVAVRRSRVDEMVSTARVGAVAVRTRSNTSTTRSPPRNWASRWPAWRWAGSASRRWPGWSEPLFSFLPEDKAWVAAHTLATIVAFMLITFLHVILGELAPKAVALERPDAVSLWVARPLAVVQPARCGPSSP